MIDVFKVGVSMTFAGNGAEFLGILLRDLGKVHVATEKLKTQFGALRTAAIGFGAVVVGGIALKGLFDLTKQAEKLNHELVKIKTGAGLNDTQVADTGSLAWRMTKEVPGTTVAGNVAAQRELFGVFGQMPEVQEVLKQVLQGNQAVSNFTDDPTDLAKVAVRALEIRGQIGKDGKIDPQKFATEFDSMVRAIVASEGLLKPRDFLQTIQQGGPAIRAMNADEFWGFMPAAMNAMGSSKSGTAVMSLFQQMVGHVVAGKRAPRRPRSRHRAAAPNGPGHLCSLHDRRISAYAARLRLHRSMRRVAVTVPGVTSAAADCSHRALSRHSGPSGVW